MGYESGNTVRGAFSVFTTGNVPVTGLVEADFSILLALDLVDSAVPVSIAEIGHGRYGYSFVAPADGYWYLTIRYASQNPRGWQDEIRVSVQVGAQGGSGYDPEAERRPRSNRDAENRERIQQRKKRGEEMAERDAIVLGLIADEVADDWEGS